MLKKIRMVKIVKSVFFCFPRCNLCCSYKACAATTTQTKWCHHSAGRASVPGTGTQVWKVPGCETLCSVCGSRGPELAEQQRFWMLSGTFKKNKIKKSLAFKPKWVGFVGFVCYLCKMNLGVFKMSPLLLNLPVMKRVSWKPMATGHSGTWSAPCQGHHESGTSVPPNTQGWDGEKELSPSHFSITAGLRLTFCFFICSR